MMTVFGHCLSVILQIIVHINVTSISLTLLIAFPIAWISLTKEISKCSNIQRTEFTVVADCTIRVNRSVEINKFIPRLDLNRL